MADNRQDYGLRWFAGQGRMPLPERHIVATSESFDINGGASNVGLGPGDVVIRKSTGGVDLCDGLQQFLLRHVFQQIAVCSRPQGIEDHVAIVVGCQHQHLDVGQTFLQSGHTLNAAHGRQIDIHQHHVRTLLGNTSQGLLAGGMRPDTSQAGRIAQTCHQAFAHVALVFDDGNGYHALRIANAVRFCLQAA